MAAPLPAELTGGEVWWPWDAGDAVEGIGDLVGTFGEAALEIAALVAEAGDDGVAFPGEVATDSCVEGDGLLL